jgi:hypothetical protein
VILGGLVTSTLLNLFVLPSLYLRFGKGKRALPRTYGAVHKGSTIMHEEPSAISSQRSARTRAEG